MTRHRPAARLALRRPPSRSIPIHSPFVTQHGALPTTTPPRARNTHHHHTRARSLDMSAECERERLLDENAHPRANRARIASASPSSPPPSPCSVSRIVQRLARGAHVAVRAVDARLRHLGRTTGTGRGRREGNGRSGGVVPDEVSRGERGDGEGRCAPAAVFPADWPTTLNLATTYANLSRRWVLSRRGGGVEISVRDGQVVGEGEPRSGFFVKTVLRHHLGCFLSHLGAWEMAMRDGAQTFVVWESDAMNLASVNVLDYDDLAQRLRAMRTWCGCTTTVEDPVRL